MEKTKTVEQPILVTGVTIEKAWNRHIKKMARNKPFFWWPAFLCVTLIFCLKIKILMQAPMEGVVTLSLIVSYFVYFLQRERLNTKRRNREFRRSYCEKNHEAIEKYLNFLRDKGVLTTGKEKYWRQGQELLRKMIGDVDKEMLKEKEEEKKGKGKRSNYSSEPSQEATDVLERNLEKELHHECVEPRHLRTGMRGRREDFIPSHPLVDSMKTRAV